ncbi:carcinoembryonic antigen-related cell adhesion molecule 5-like [Callorhinchus milii]|uniref:carcinoembryonic antigen-related cell adhesion molecule 5-like n=1 Tax=Callorhinchus milii TaxID=7868 RepID=UPI001C3F9986|nr:carcinoembryonic antigen-related cell adhesion molecule 5-like [Callorhinchus milii]
MFPAPQGDPGAPGCSRNPRVFPAPQDVPSTPGAFPAPQGVHQPSAHQRVSSTPGCSRHPRVFPATPQGVSGGTPGCSRHPRAFPAPQGVPGAQACSRRPGVFPAAQGVPGSPECSRQPRVFPAPQGFPGTSGCSQDPRGVASTPGCSRHPRAFPVCSKYTSNTPSGVMGFTAQFTITVPDNPITAAAGGTAVFTVKPSGEVKTGTWSIGRVVFVTWFPGGESIDPGYKDRIVFTRTSGSLQLNSVNYTDAGDYTVTMFSPSDTQATATITLKVVENITSVTVTQNIPNPIEYNDTVTLTCDVKGTVESRLWFKDERALHSNDRITISQDNATLTIISVTRNDGGTYRCEAKNSFSSQSGSHTLSIAYGPDTPELTITGTHSAELGDSLTLSCSAQSNPEAQYKWIFNGTVLSHTSSNFTIHQISQNDLGRYTCQARNNITLRVNETTLNVTLQEKITSVTVTQNIPNPIEYNDNVTLTCDVKGTVESRLWFKDERALHSNDRITISQDNATLTIISVTRNDGGTYRCEAKNSFSSVSGSHTLSIAYGPDTPELTITGTHSAELGDSLTLSCSAQSNPEAQYQWIFNGTVLSHTSSNFTIHQISQNDLGRYTCQARNNITLRVNETTLNVTLQDKGSPPNSLSGGAIAGIVIACIVGVALITALVVWVVKVKGRAKSGSHHQNGVTMAATGNIPPSQTEYATVQRKEQNLQSPHQSNSGANTATANRDNEIVYAQPHLLQGGATAPKAAINDNKTDYAELKFK